MEACPSTGLFAPSTMALRPSWTSIDLLRYPESGRPQRSRHG
jgi:hypothetical protein